MVSRVTCAEVVSPSDHLTEIDLADSPTGMVNCGTLDDWERYEPPAEISRMSIFPLSSVTLTSAPIAKPGSAFSLIVKLRAPGGGTDSKNLHRRIIICNKKVRPTIPCLRRPAPRLWHRPKQ